MKFKFAALFVATTTLFAGCTNLERSRNLADPKVPSLAIAQQVCSLCHGLSGNATNPNFPNLAGQQPGYLVSQMKAFRSHQRADPAGFEYMWGLSKNLTDAQIEGLAAYFADQRAEAPAGNLDGDSTARGKVIFDSGLSQKGIPACAACHGPQGQGNATFPRIALQHADYLVKQLMVFQRTDDRPDGSVMKTIAHDLTVQDMQDVAAYLQQLKASITPVSTAPRPPIPAVQLALSARATQTPAAH